MLVMLYRGGSLDSNMKQEEEKKRLTWLLSFLTRLIKHTTRIIVSVTENSVVCTERCVQKY